MSLNLQWHQIPAPKPQRCKCVAFSEANTYERVCLGVMNDVIYDSVKGQSVHFVSPD